MVPAPENPEKRGKNPSYGSYRTARADVAYAYRTDLVKPIKRIAYVLVRCLSNVWAGRLSLIRLLFRFAARRRGAADAVGAAVRTGRRPCVGGHPPASPVRRAWSVRWKDRRSGTEY